MKHFLAQHVPIIRQHLCSMCYTLFSYGRGFLILFLCLWFGNLIESFIPISIPGSIIGLLILFFLLTFQLIPTKWVSGSCSLFMRYMTLLFIPAAMGIMDSYVYLIHSWAPIIIGSIASTFIVLILVAKLTQYMSDRTLRKNNPNFSEENR